MHSKKAIIYDHSIPKQRNPKKVLMVTAYYLPSHGGIENHIYGLSHALSERGWGINILATTRQNLPSESTNGIQVDYQKTSLNPFNNPISLRLLNRILHSNGHLIHVHGLYQFTSLISKIASYLTKKPIILTMHGIANYSGIMGTFQRIYEVGFLRIKPQITHYVALTNADVEFLSRYGVERERISIIPNAVDSSYWKPDSNLPERQKDILFVGSLIKRKRPDLLIEAFRDYSTIVKDSHLHIVGDGPELENIRRQINDYNLAQSVSLLGRIPLTNLLQLYQHSDLLVLPSIAEGLPTVLLEAMACGTIPIATDLPGNRDVIQNERNGLLFQLDDKESLLRSLLYTNSLSNENRQRIRESAIETVRTQFSWNSVSNKMVSLYEMILENHLKQ